MPHTFKKGMISAPADDTDVTKVIFKGLKLLYINARQKYKKNIGRKKPNSFFSTGKRIALRDFQIRSPIG